MSWEEGNDIVDLARALLLACPGFVALLGEDAPTRCHYPRFSLKNEGLPAALFEESQASVERVGGFERGRVAVVLYVHEQVTIAQLEAAARTIYREAVTWTGPDVLAVVAAERGRATEPSPAQKAAADDETAAPCYRCVTLVLTWEG